ncbi:GNAT family N-acetyltransferase [Glycomyces tarimensis]
MSDFTIGRLDPTDHRMLRSMIDTALAVHGHDRVPLPAPSLPGFILSTIQHRLDHAEEHWIAVADGEVAGFARLVVPVRDNTHLLQFDVRVHPRLRGRGIGSAMLDHAEARAAELERTTLTCFVRSPVPEGPDFLDLGTGFLERRGYGNSMTMGLRVVDLDAVDDAELDRLWTEAWQRADGFELVTFEGEPDASLVDGIAYLHGRIFTDSPTGDWDVREMVFDADRLRDEGRADRERGVLRLQAAMIHTATGAVAGTTEIHVYGGNERTADQGDTIVDPRFRGHRLGTILKIANQRRVREWRPRIRYIWTGNAEDNRHMIAINEAVGYRRAALGSLFQKRLA